VKIEAVPINPADLMTLLATGDLDRAQFTGPAERPRVTMPLAPSAQRSLARRIGLSLTVGLEGAGTVIAAGTNTSQLLGKKVAVLSMGAGMFGQYRTVRSEECCVLPDGVAVEAGAGLFVNPLTALAIVETVRLEGHTALIHTAAASSLGQMLIKVCAEDGVPIVNVVRRQEQVKMLRALGAEHVCDSSLPNFRDDLRAAVEATGATVAFDALGGGAMVSELLAAIETVGEARMPYYSAYGSIERKHVYVYGHLERSQTTLSHDLYGLVWGVSGWLMPSILERIGFERASALRQRVVSQLTTTFAVRYTKRITLADVLRRDTMLAYSRHATGEKYLITPNA
jgi:NADPH:quinone reductase